MPVPDAAHALFSLDPKDFVTARDQLAKNLQNEGDKDGAKTVKALRRPTVPIWALNQVAREQPDEIEALVAASSQAHAAQDKDVRDALVRRRDRMHDVLVLARQMIDGSGRTADQHELDITSAFGHDPGLGRTDSGSARWCPDPGFRRGRGHRVAGREWDAASDWADARTDPRARRARASSRRGRRCGDACGRCAREPGRGPEGARACRGRGGASGGVSGQAVAHARLTPCRPFSSPNRSRASANSG